MRFIFALLLTLITSQAFAAASIVPAFGTLSTATGGKTNAGKSGTNTLTLIGATASTVGGKPTLTITQPGILASGYASLPLADAAAYATGKHLIIDTAWTLGSSYGFQSAVSFRPGGTIAGTMSFAVQPEVASGASPFTGSTVTGLTLARPEWWGCVANGSANCTTAMQKAAASLTGGGKFVLGAGSYGVNGSTKLLDNTTVEGAGMGVTTVKILPGASGSINIFQNNNYTAYGGFQNPVEPDYTLVTPNYNISLRSMTLDCNRAASAAVSNGFIFTLVEGISIERVHVLGASQKGGYLQSSKSISVSRCRFTGNLLNGLHVTDCLAFDIHHNYFKDNNDYSLEVGAGDSLSVANATLGLPAAYGGEGSITCNIIDGGVSVGIYLRGLNSKHIQDVKVMANTVRNMVINPTDLYTGAGTLTPGADGIPDALANDPSTGSGIATSNSTQKLEIVGNTLENNANAGIYVFSGTGTSRYSITDNYLYGNKNGLNLSGVTSSNITNNHVHSSKAAAGIVNYLYNCIFKDNEFVGNGTVTADKSVVVTNTQLTFFIGNIFKSESHTVNFSEGTGNANTNTYFGNDTPQGNTITSGSKHTKDTFTPVVSFGGGSVGINYSIQVGQYVLDNNMLYYQIQIALSTKGSSTGALSISGLPYTSGSIAAASSVRLNNMASGLSTTVQGLVNNGATSVGLTKLVSGVATALTDADFTNTSSLVITGMYFLP